MDERFKKALALWTRYRVKCPECGKIALAENVLGKMGIVRCRGCKAEFRGKENAYRPVTEGMTQQEKWRYYNSRRKKRGEMTPQELEHARELDRRKYRRRTPDQKRRYSERDNARRRERWATDEAYREKRKQEWRDRKASAKKAEEDMHKARLEAWREAKCSQKRS